MFSCHSSCHIWVASEKFSPFGAVVAAIFEWLVRKVFLSVAFVAFYSWEMVATSGNENEVLIFFDLKI